MIKKKKIVSILNKDYRIICLYANNTLVGMLNSPWLWNEKIKQIL